jgi:uncharacterized protein
MLKIKPNCEHCDADLAPDSPDARICSFECTFCASCVDNVLNNVCPNCGGGLLPRPIRPREKLDLRPASIERMHKPVDMLAHAKLLARYRDIDPVER